MPELDPNAAPETNTGPAGPPAGAPETPPAAEPAATRVGSNGKEFATNDEGDSLGFPKDTAVKDMTPVEGEAYWKHQSRRWERRATSAPNQQELERLQAENKRLTELNQTEDQKAREQAIEDAKAAARAEADQFYKPQINEIQLHSYASQVLGVERADQWVQTANPSAFLNDDGRIDGQKVTALLTNLFSVSDPDSPPAKTPPAPGTYQQAGQGQPPAITKPNHRDQARAQIERRKSATAGY